MDTYHLVRIYDSVGRGISSIKPVMVCLDFVCKPCGSMIKVFTSLETFQIIAGQPTNCQCGEKIHLQLNRTEDEELAAVILRVEQNFKLLEKDIEDENVRWRMETTGRETFYFFTLEKKWSPLLGEERKRKRTDVVETQGPTKKPTTGEGSGSQERADRGLVAYLVNEEEEEEEEEEDEKEEEEEEEAEDADADDDGDGEDDDDDGEDDDEDDDQDDDYNARYNSSEDEDVDRIQEKAEEVAVLESRPEVDEEEEAVPLADEEAVSGLRLQVVKV